MRRSLCIESVEHPADINNHISHCVSNISVSNCRLGRIREDDDDFSYYCFELFKSIWSKLIQKPVAINVISDGSCWAYNICPSATRCCQSVGIAWRNLFSDRFPEISNAWVIKQTSNMAHRIFLILQDNITREVLLCINSDRVEILFEALSTYIRRHFFFFLFFFIVLCNFSPTIHSTRT